ncbi:MAG: type IV toxin-antitoxin system AbiEi family antitoxin [Kiritimatiellia bacterium]|nr:type IV toxin-antitoxin system AbiEi family antitoxin [Kiritimatiellia bacterium]
MKIIGAVEYIRRLLQSGKVTFSRSEAAAVLGAGATLSNKLSRLESKGWIMPVGRGFYAIIEPNDQAHGFASAYSFLDDWARHRELLYYVGGVSAAAIHGASHQSAQEVQVVADRVLRPFGYRELKIVFFLKRSILPPMWAQQTVRSGYLRVATPEMTAYDLLSFPKACRSLSRAATILVELGEAMQGSALKQLPELGCGQASLQRLGWLLDRTGWNQLGDALHQALRPDSAPWRLLEPQRPRLGKRNARWRIVENTQVEPDIEKGKNP